MRPRSCLLLFPLLTIGCPPDPPAPPPASPPAPSANLPAPAKPELESIARPRTAPGLVADAQRALLEGPDTLALPDVSAHSAKLTEDRAPAPERLTRLVITVAQTGATQAQAPEPDVAWLGMWLPSSRATGTPRIDLNERRVRLRYLAATGAVPLKTPQDDARVAITVGTRSVPGWSALAELVATWPADTPVIVDAHVHVPMGHVATALTIILARGFAPRLAAPEVAYAAGGLPTLEAATRQAIADAAAAAPKDAQGLPRLGLRLRADARARWANVCTVLSAAVAAKVRRVTLAANAGEVEIDLFSLQPPPRAVGLLQEYDPKQRRTQVEKPIIILEEEVEVTRDVPKGIPFGRVSNKNLDSTSVVDAYGVGGGAAGVHGGRFSKAALRREGGSARTEAAVRAALGYLRKQQRPDGRWSAGDGAAYLDPGLTGLALLAYQGSGVTHRYGRSKIVVSKGTRWLKRAARADGSFGYRADRPAQSLIAHALATEALAELYAITRDPFLKRYAQKAAQFAALGYPPDVRLDPKKPQHVAVVVHLLRALRAARLAKLELPPQAEPKLLAWIDEDLPDAGVITERLRRARPCTFPDALATPPVEAHPRLLTTEAWFLQGGAGWKSHSKRLQQRLLARQDTKTGGWKATGEWFLEGSSIAVTALNALALETYTRITRPKPKK